MFFKEVSMLIKAVVDQKTKTEKTNFVKYYFYILIYFKK